MRILVPVIGISVFVGCVEPTPTPDPDAEGTSVFVVGDSWAELSQGTIPLFSTDMMPATALANRGHTVLAEYTYGFGGTAAVFWAAGDPCGTPGSCGDGGVYDRFFADLETAPGTPFIYLSLGGNDIRVGGDLVDLSTPDARGEVFGNIDDGMNLFVDEILATRPDADIVIAGYANFTTAGNSIDFTPCSDVLSDFVGVPNVDDQLVNSLFNEGAYDGEPIDGLAGIYRDLADAHSQVHYTGHPHLFGGDPEVSWSPSTASTMLDCIHLPADRQRNFVVAVVDDWVEPSPDDR